MSIIKNILGTYLQDFHINFNSDGPLLRDNAGILEIRDADGVSLARVRAAAPLTDSDLATKFYVDAISKPVIIERQADCSVAIPNNTAVRGFVVVTTAGSGASIGDLLYDDGSNSGQMQIIPAVDGQAIAVTTSLTGGTISFDADSIYLWDATGGSWVKVGDVGAVTGARRTVRFAIDNTAQQDSVSQILLGNVIHSVAVKIVTPYSGGATLEIGTTADPDLIMTTSDTNLQKPAGRIFVKEQDTVWPIDSVVRATIAGGPAAGDAIVIVEFSNPIG
jgi:hypothetical protein